MPAFHGTATITATATGLCGTTATDRVVTVNPTTGVPVFTAGAVSICQNAADATYTATAANSTSITYSVSPSAAGVIDPITGVMNWDEAFSGPATITAIANGLCGTFSSNIVVNVDPTPLLLITNPAPECAPSTVDLTASAVTSGSTSGLILSYWTNAGASSSYATPMVTTAGTYYIKGATATGCFDIKPVIVTVNQLPVLTSTLTPGSICSNSVFSYAPTSSTIGTIYNWTRAAITGISNSAGAGTGNPNETLINTTAAPATVHYIYTLSANGCTNPSTFDVAVVVNPTPVLISILTPAPVCSTSPFSYTPASLTVGTAFNWARPLVAGISNLAAAGTDNPNETLINTTFDPVVVTYTYTLSANGCSNVQNVPVTVNPKPILSSTLTPPAICSNSEFSYTPTSPTAATTFSWTRAVVTGISNGAAAGVASVNEILINTTTSPRVVTYAYTLTANGCTNIQNVTVTVNPVPVASTSSPTTICSGTSTNIVLNSTVAGTTFNWTIGPVTGGITGATSSNGTVINQTLFNPGTTSGSVLYTLTPSANTCVGIPLNLSVIVNPSTGVPIFTTGGTSICQDATDETYTATATNSMAIIYSVLPSSAGIINPATGVMTWDAAFNGPATIRATADGICRTTIENRIVTVNASTGSPLFTAGAVSVCQDAPDETYTAISANSTSITYSVSPLTAGVIDPVSGIMNWDEDYSGPATITATASGLCGTLISNRVVNVDPKPLLLITNPAPVCSSNPVDLTSPAITSGSTAGLTYSYWTNAGATSAYATPAATTSGTYYIKGTSASGCYDIKPVTVTVNPIPVALAGGSQTICFGESATVTGASYSEGTLIWTTNGSGALSNETSLTPTYTPVVSDMGSTVTLTMTVTSDNSCFPQTATADYIINIKQNQSIIFDPITDKVYGDNAFLLSSTASSSLDVIYSSSNNSVASVSGNTVTITGAGTATIYANQPGNDSYCAAPQVLQILSIAPKSITVKADHNQSKFFGDPDPILTYTVTPDLIGEDEFAGSLSRLAGEELNTPYAITQGTLDGGPDYLITFVPDNFTITIGTITITVDENQSKIYGGPDPVLTYTVTPASVVTGSLTGTLSRSPGEDAGSSYLISQGTLASENYTLNFVPANFTITPAPITITAMASQSKVYGEADPILLYNLTPSLIGTDELSGALSRDTGENVGISYNITQGTLDAGSNYAQTFVSSNFSITPKPLTVTASPKQSKEYGAADPELSFTFTPEMIGLDGFTGSLSRTAGENVSSFYHILIGTLSAGPNYNVTFVTNNFSITPKLITLTVTKGQSKIYGSGDPVFSYTYSPQLLGNDVVSGSLTRSTGENAGDYGIQLGSISMGHNYTIIFVPTIFTIYRAPLTVLADSKERSFLEPNPVFTFSFSGFVNGDNKNDVDVLPSISTTATSTSDAGNYGIIVVGGIDNNYYFIYKMGILTISKADQYITFDEIPDKLRISQTYELVANASSGLPVSFESSDLKKAVISGNIMLVNKEGRNIVIAKQEGNVNWNPAPNVSNSYVGQPSFDNITSLFTPNGDGVNDYWYIPDIEDFGSIQVKVYNRFGKLVYESQDYKNDWNGTFNGSPLPSASYYYIIKSSEKGIINGVVNIVR